MNLLNCHGEERSDVAIHLDLWWIAAPSFLGLAMTMIGVEFRASYPRRG